MNKVVITGGMSGGKSTIHEIVAEEFKGQVLSVPEVATVMLNGGFPLPGKDLKWSPEWQMTFQKAIFPLQKAFEDAKTLEAEEKGIKLLECDRGILDGAAYTPGGVEEFSRIYGVNIKDAWSQYVAIIHLESLAVIDSERFMKNMKANNDKRFEDTLERAIELELATKEAWKGHPNHFIIDGRNGMEGKIIQTMKIIRSLLIPK